MLARPQFRPDADLHVLPGEGVFVVSDRGTVLLKGRLYELVAPLLDGTRTPQEIAASLRHDAPAAEIYYTIELLEQKGYAVEPADNWSRGEAALFAARAVDPGVAARRLGSATVTLKQIGRVPAFAAAPLFDSVHLQLAEEGRSLLVATDDYLQPDLASVNADAIRLGRPWMLLRPVGLQMLVGPIFNPARSACWECLAARLRLTRHVDRFLEDAARGRPPRGGQCATPATSQVAWTIAASRLAQWIASDGDAALEREVLSIDVLSWKTESHTLVRRPQCRVCGAPPADAPALRLVSRRKIGAADAQHRTATAGETLARFGHHVSPYTGAVRALDRLVDSSGDVVHVFVAGHNHALANRSVDALRSSLRHCSAGKGLTETEARASGLCEALERHSAVFEGYEPRVRGTLASLGAAAIHPNACMLFSDRQYRERQSRSAGGSIFTHVPRVFDEHAEIDWTPLWSVTHETVRYLPTGYCYFDVPRDDPEGSLVACSNGNAAASTIEEAVLHGLFELLERDSVALWWYNRLRRRGVDLDSFGTSYYRRLAAALRDQHREYWALDLTADSVPAFAAISRRVDGPREAIALGFGAHLDARVALARAVTEMNQMMSWPLVEAAAAERARLLDPGVLSWLDSATVASQTYLLPDPASSPMTLADYPTVWSDDVLDDIRECRRRVEAQGLEILILDQTRPDIGLPVVKVVVPGLRHFWARFAPGRLYDVPVRLGWLPAPLAEDDLNPVPMFI